MALTSDQITAQNFKDFYGQIRPYLNGTAHGGFTPIGTVISLMGKTAPINYLICDGTVYNIVDYPELAAYFAGQFNSSNFFGGDGTTTFAVPDLRGEFLRGTGTNSHANQGNGLTVGTHQDGTLYPYIGVNTQQTSTVWTASVGTSDQGGNGIYALNSDTLIIGYGGNNKGMDSKNSLSGKWDGANNVTNYTGRPTNTSVLYCIATHNMFMNEGSNYSTDEQIVGTWVNGKPIYQKTFTGTTSATTTSDSVAGTISNFDTLINSNGTIFLSGAWGVNQHSLPYNNVAEYYVDDSNQIIIHKQNEIANNKQYMVTLQYTKTTD